jgi:hypothetical protein
MLHSAVNLNRFSWSTPINGASRARSKSSSTLLRQDYWPIHFAGHTLKQALEINSESDIQLFYDSWGFLTNTNYAEEPDRVFELVDYLRALDFAIASKKDPLTISDTALAIGVLSDLNEVDVVTYVSNGQLGCYLVPKSLASFLFHYLLFMKMQRPSIELPVERQCAGCFEVVEPNANNGNSVRLLYQQPFFCKSNRCQKKKERLIKAKKIAPAIPKLST